MSMRLRCASVLTLLCALVATSPAQDPRHQAWSVLDKGLTDSSTDKRTKAVLDLGLLPDDSQAIAAGIAALKDDKSEVRAAAAQALGEMSAKSASRQLRDALQDDEPAVVLAASHALLTLGDKSGYDAFYGVLTGQQKAGRSLIDEQKKVLTDPKKLAGIGLQTGLGFVPFGGVGWWALKTLTKDDAAPVVAAAALTLADDPDPDSGKALAKAALADKKWLVRAAAYQALAKRGDPSLKGTAVLGLQDENEAVQFAAAAAVIRLSDIESSSKRKHKPVRRHTPPRHE